MDQLPKGKQGGHPPPKGAEDAFPTPSTKQPPTSLTPDLNLRFGIPRLRWTPVLRTWVATCAHQLQFLVGKLSCRHELTSQRTFERSQRISIHIRQLLLQLLRGEAVPTPRSHLDERACPTVCCLKALLLKNGIGVRSCTKLLDCFYRHGTPWDDLLRETICHEA